MLDEIRSRIYEYVLDAVVIAYGEFVCGVINVCRQSLTQIIGGMK